jgi:hypothetical protein
MGRAKPVPTTLDSRRERSHSRESKLWRVVLQRAILDAFAQPGKGGATVRDTVEAQRWLADGGSDLAFACEGAGLDSGMIESWARDMVRDGWPRHRYEVYRQIARGLDSSIAAE